MRPEFRCSSCVYGVLTGVLPGGVSEYACCKDNYSAPYFYYDVNPERVSDCVDYANNRRKHSRSQNQDFSDLFSSGGQSYYDFDL